MSTSLPAPLAQSSVAGLDARTLAKGLGWFSLALGAVELLAPGAIKRHVGTPGSPLLLQAYGLREIGAGAAILLSDRPVGMVWGRVVGDALDIATLVPALHPDNPHRAGAVGAMAFVLGATALDVAVALQGDG